MSQLAKCAYAVSLAVCLLLPPMCLAQQKEPPAPPEVPKETVFALKVKPADAPMPMLKYELVPNFRDLTRSNAAMLYQRAILLYAEATRPGKETYDARIKIEEAMQKPLADLPKDELRAYLKPYNSVFKELHAASLCDRCDWGIIDRITVERFGVLLPEVQKCRELAFILKVSARLNLAEGNLDAALHDIQTGIKLGINVGTGDTLIQFLVGTAIVTIMMDEIQQYVQHPKASNLYWALTVLPRPLISLEKPMQGELRGIDSTIPLPRDIDKPMTVEQARAALDEVWDKMQKFAGDTQTGGVPKLGVNESRLALASYITMQYPKAKKSLISIGRPEAVVNAMPAAQVIMLDSSLRYQNLRDEYMLWMVIPYEEAKQGMKTAEEKYRLARNEPFDYFVVMLNLLMPATQKVYEAQLRTQRRYGSMRVVEAVRLHYAKTGKIPATLDDVKLVPLPSDPATGKPFQYTVTEKGFVVTVDAPPGQKNNLGNAWKYQIEWAK